MNFEDIKDQIRNFVKEELYSLEPWILNCTWEEKLPKLNEHKLSRLRHERGPVPEQYA